MRGLNLTSIVFGFMCGSLSAHPVWNEQRNCLEDTHSQCSVDYNQLKDSDLLKDLLAGKKTESLRNLIKNMDGDCMNFLARVQSLMELNEVIPIEGALAKILKCNQISGVTAVYIYQIFFSEDGEDLGSGFDEYIKGLL